MFRFVVLPCFDLCRSNSFHEKSLYNFEDLLEIFFQ